MGSLDDEIDPKSLEAALLTPGHVLFEGSPTWTPVDVHRRYRYITTKLLDLLAEREEMAELIPRLEQTWKIKRAKTRVQELAKNPTIRAGDLEDLAVLACMDEHFEFRLAEERARYLSDAIAIYKKVLGILQSVGVDSRIMEGSSMYDVPDPHEP